MMVFVVIRAKGFVVTSCGDLRVNFRVLSLDSEHLSLDVIAVL